MKFSDFFKLNARDLAKGILLAFITAIVTAVTQTVSNGGLPTLPQLKGAALVGLSAAIAYLIKNLLTNNEDEFFKKDA